MKDSISARFGEYSLNFWNDIATKDFSVKKELDSGDGIHLNDAGHGLLAKKVIERNIPEMSKKLNVK